MLLLLLFTIANLHACVYNELNYSFIAIMEYATRNTTNDLPLYLKIIFIATTFILGCGLSFLFLRQTDKKNLDSRYPIETPVNQSLISLDLLQNPMLSDWSGRVQGKVTSISANSITVLAVKDKFVDKQHTYEEVANASPINVKIVTGKTSFIGEGHKTLSVSDVKIGQIINGSVDIIKNGNDWTLEAKTVSVY